MRFEFATQQTSEQTIVIWAFKINIKHHIPRIYPCNFVVTGSASLAGKSGLTKNWEGWKSERKRGEWGGFL